MLIDGYRFQSACCTIRLLFNFFLFHCTVPDNYRISNATATDEIPYGTLCADETSGRGSCVDNLLVLGEKKSVTKIRKDRAT